jgi:hypothetical protein
MNRRRHIFVFPLGLALLITGRALGYAPDVFVPNLLRPVETEPKDVQIDDPKAAMKIVGVRNGSFSGRVVIHQDYPVECPPVSMGELKLKDGDTVIPADAVQLRYGCPFYSRQPNPKYDTLSPKPQEEKNVIHAIWLVIQIPKDQAPGLYEGTLQCGDRKVPVTLKVIDWVLPDPKDFVTFVDFIQSPESVALQYNVKLWSDEHLKYIGKSFEQMARVGCRAIYIHLAGRSNLGNEHTHVRLIMVGDDVKKIKYDFVPFERYLDLFIEKIGKPKIVVMYAYEGSEGGSQGKTKEQCEKGVQFDVVDPETGELSHFRGPAWNNRNDLFPNYPADAKAFWQPIVDGIHKRVTERGILEKAIMWGLSPDLKPGGHTIALMLEMAPYSSWADHGHGRCGRVSAVQRGTKSKRKPMPCGYTTVVWGAYPIPDPDAKKRGHAHGWRNTRQYSAWFPRDIWRAGPIKLPAINRMMAERNAGGGQNGFGRMSADFWFVLGKGKRRGAIASRFTSWSQLNLRMAPYFAPGLHGADNTYKFQMIVEGVQECEARIHIDRALLDKDLRAKLGEDMAKRLQDLLDDRARAIIGCYGNKKTKKKGDFNSYIEGWQERSEKLYTAAMEVTAALAAPAPAPTAPAAKK